VFNFNTQTVKFADNFSAKQIIQADPSRLALVDASLINEWQAEHLNLAILADFQGFNYSKGRWLSLYLVKTTSGEK
jgi:hypothetical protein